MTLETILRANVGFVSAMAGALRGSILDAAHELVPDLEPLPVRKRLPEARHEFDPEHIEEPTGSRDASGRFVSVWRRRRRSDDGQSLAEYALLLALIAVVAIIAVMFIGQQVAQVLSDVGNSI